MWLARRVYKKSKRTVVLGIYCRRCRTLRESQKNEKEEKSKEQEKEKKYSSVIM